MSLNEKQLKLLNNLEEDRKHINKKLYSAGPYWDSKTKKIVFWLKKNGVYNFRSKNSGVGTSYTDNYVKDVRNEFNFKGNEDKYKGVMSDEVPWAVLKDNDDYDIVDYNQIDVTFEKIS